jgi:hypothetical protein
MKKEKPTNKPGDETPLNDRPIENDISSQEKKDDNSIQDFIEMKKLQNRILGKMIEKINQAENKNKSKNK